MVKAVLKHLIQIVGVVVVLIAGVLAAVALKSSAPAPDRQNVAESVALVETMTVKVEDVATKVRGHGTVRPGVRIDVVPQVSGTVVELNPALRAGGIFAKGELLIRIDTTDYDLAARVTQAELEQAGAVLQNATATITEIEARREDAQIELKRLQEMRAGASTTQRELDRAELLLAQVDARLIGARAIEVGQRSATDSAGARLEAAQVQVARTKIFAPFDGRVMSEQVDEGQLAVAGRTLATIYSVDALEIKLPIEDSQLAWFDAPMSAEAASDGERSSAATLKANFAGRDRQWSGRATRLEGEVHPTSRMVNVIVEVTEPSSQDEQRIMLMPGMFVEVEIEGRTATQVSRIPRRGLRSQSVVWVVEDERLRFKNVQIVRRARDDVYVRGLEAGERIVISVLDIVTDGMKVREE